MAAKEAAVIQPEDRGHDGPIVDLPRILDEKIAPIDGASPRRDPVIAATVLFEKMAAVKDRGLFPGLGIRRHAPLKILADDVRRAGQLRVLVAQLLFKFPVVIPLVIGHGRVIVPAARLLILQLMPFVIGIGNEGQRRRIVAVGAVVL